jgi:diguanylate cyclase (GGDEF)-like protein
MELLRRFYYWSLNTIKGRFLVSTAFLLIIGGLLTVLPLVVLVYNQREQEVAQNLDEALRMQQMVINEWIDGLSNDVVYLGSTVQTRESLYNRIDQFAANRADFDDIFVVNQEGNVEYTANGDRAAGTLNVADRDYFQAAIDGGTFATGVTERRTDNKPVVLFSAPIRNKNGDIDGVIAGMVKMDAIRSIINTFQFGETGRLYLTNPSGRVLNQADGTSPLTLSGTDVFKHALKKETQPHFHENTVGVTVMMQYRWIHNGEWLLVGEMETAEINAPFWRLLFVISGILLFVFTIASVVIRLLMQQIIFPIDKLLEGTVILRLGNYSHRISDQVLDQSLDEFKALHGAYNQMARSLDQEFSLRRLAEKELRQANEMLKRLSLSDSLTGIGNRRYFDEVLELSWEEAAQKEKPLSLLLIDIDFFKKYNDRYGHDAGDKALRCVAMTVDNTVKTSGAIAARYGGEEMAVIIPPGLSAESYGLAELIRQSVEKLHIPHADLPAGIISVSIGTATVRPRSDQKPELLIQQADQALYHSKHKGRARTTVYESITP